MKKVLSILLCVVFALGVFAGCTQQEPAAEAAAPAAPAA